MVYQASAKIDDGAHEGYNSDPYQGRTLGLSLGQI